MKRVFKLFLSIVVCFVSLLSNASPIILPFDGVFHFEYSRDDFQFLELSEKEITKSLRGTQLQLENVELPHRCGVYECYSTGQKGVGFVLSLNDKMVTAENAFQPIALSSDPFKLKGKLVVYEKLESGSYTLNAASLPKLIIDKQQYPLQFPPISLVIKQRTCELTSEKNQQIHLKPIAVDELNVKQEIVGNQFKLSLKCDPKVAAKVVFRDQITPTNQGDYLTLAPESTAQGVGIAIVRNDNQQKIKFGEQWQFSQNEQTPTRTFSANYLKIGTISAGSIKAIATVSFTYH